MELDVKGWHVTASERKVRSGDGVGGFGSGGGRRKFTTLKFGWQSKVEGEVRENAQYKEEEKKGTHHRDIFSHVDFCGFATHRHPRHAPCIRSWNDASWHRGVSFTLVSTARVSMSAANTPKAPNNGRMCLSHPFATLRALSCRLKGGKGRYRVLPDGAILKSFAHRHRHHRAAPRLLDDVRSHHSRRSLLDRSHHPRGFGRALRVGDDPS